MPFISSVRSSYGAQGRFGARAGLLATSTGGTITTSGGYRIHTFQYAQTGTAFVPSGTGTVEYLVVAGGAGGSQQHSGGGGAGGMRTGTLSVNSGQTYTITVGNGGAFQPNVGGCSGHTTPAGNGGSSTFSTITSIGGGYPGCYATFDAFAGPNGSGGGGKNAVPGLGGPGTAGQGYAGGSSTYNHVGGGGGGAGEVGTDATYIVNTNTNYRSGGNGLQSSISGTATYYAGGGGGGSHNVVALMTGGLGGGANGGQGPGAGFRAPTSAVDGTGGGGGGNGECQPNSSQNQPPTRGGHGVVIVRYLA